MVKRNVKRALGIFLSIVLMFTTFFIFDPSVLKVDTQAYVATTQPTLTNDDVFFYVPEVIYLAPSTTGETGTVGFKWFADRENADNGEITKSVADKTAGSVYFHCVIAKSYIINVSLPDGCSISNVDTGTWKSGNSYSTNQMTGSALNTQGQKIIWTVTWKDSSGRSYSATRYSTIYKPNYVASGGAGRSKRTAWDKSGYMQGLIYINGFANNYTGGSYVVQDAYNTSLYPDWALKGTNVGSINYLTETSGGPMCYGNSDTVNHTLSGLNLFLDRSRFSNYNQIPNFTYTVAITDFETTDENREGALCYDTTSASASQPFYVPSNNLREQIYRGRINAGTPGASTSPSSHYFYGYFQGKYGGTGRTNVTINFNVYAYDKSSLRNAYDYAVKSSKYLQQQWYTDSVWSAYTTAFNNVVNALEGVEDANGSNYDALANTLISQVDTLKNAFVGAIYKDGIVKTGTVTVHHKYVTGGSGESITSAATICDDETLTYYYGENVITGFNNLSSSPDRGYVNYGYASGNFSSGTLTLGTGNNTYTFVETPSLECTYVYLKKSLVTFDANGGSCSTSNKTVTYSDAYGDLPTTTREGYTFNGWYTSTSGGSQITASTTAWILEDQTIYAQWTPNTYTVNFDPNGGSCDTANMTVTYDSTYGDLPTPTRTGYSFSGWYTAAIGGTLIDADTKVQNTTTQTLYAHWTATSYTVTFNANGGSCDTANKSVTYNSAYGTLPTATRKGYSFNGWYTAASGGSKVSETTKVTTMSDHTLYAQWTATSYTVTFNANGGSCDTASKSVVYDSAYGTLPTASRTGYTFTGWFTAESGGSKVDETTTVGNASNHTLYAQWSANSYTVTFNANGGSCGTANKSVTFDSAYGALPTASRTGYTFSGWYTAETSGSKVEESTVVKIADNHTVYARWSASSYTVTFDANGGSCGTKSKSVVFGSTYGSLPTASRTGYTFTGWFTEASDGSLVDATTVVNTASDHTVYAHWSANSYTLTFITNGGYCATSVMSVTYDSTYGVLPIATRAGYNFEGWFTQVSGGSRVVETTVVTTTSDQTVYAQWTANSYTVYFSPNGGSCCTASKVVTFDSTYGELPTATKTGYNFTGWYTSEIGGTKCEASTLVKTAKDHILHAHWTANYYIAYFDANGGSCSTTHKIVVYNSAYGELPTATKSGYTFDGWFTAASGGTKIDASSLVATANEHTLYAHWSANSHFDPKGTCVIDGSYIYGLKTKLTSSALKNTYLDYENVELTIENPTGGRYLGTGSTVTVEYPDGTTEVYTIVIFGDVDGDGNITADDSASLKSYINGTSSEDFTAAQKKASNLDGSRRIDVDDFSMLSSAASGAIELNQADPSESK